MNLFNQCTLALLAIFAISCSNVEPKTAAKPINVEAPVVELDQMPDIPTLTDNHKILLVRVAGDLSKVSDATKLKLTSLTKSFNESIEKLKSAIQQRDMLRDKLADLNANTGTNKTLETEKEIGAVSVELMAANSKAVEAESHYQEMARAFTQLIEVVKKERSKN